MTEHLTRLRRMGIYALTPEAEQLRLRRIHYPKRRDTGPYSMFEPPLCAECGVHWSLCRVFGCTDE